MASVASQLIEEVTEHAQSEGLEDAREICADSTYFPNNLCTYITGTKAEVKDTWSRTSTLPTRLDGVDKETFTFSPGR